MYVCMYVCVYSLRKSEGDCTCSDRLKTIAARQTKSKQQLDAEDVSVDSYVTYQSGEVYVCMHLPTYIQLYASTVHCAGTVDVPVDPLLTASDDVELLQHALESRPDTHGYRT